MTSPVPPMTQAAYEAALHERELLRRRVQRLNRFLDDPCFGPSSDASERVAREARDTAAEELLHLELTLSLAVWARSGAPSMPRPRPLTVQPGGLQR